MSVYYPAPRQAVRWDSSGVPTRDAPQGSVERYAYYIACHIPAYKEPVPPGLLSASERDALAMDLGRRWWNKVAAGGSSCAMHEVWEHAMRQPRPACRICGGSMSSGGGTHELCRLREAAGRATPRLNYTPSCGCSVCQRAEGAL